MRMKTFRYDFTENRQPTFLFSKDQLFGYFKLFLWLNISVAKISYTLKFEYKWARFRLKVKLNMKYKYCKHETHFIS